MRTNFAIISPGRCGSNHLASMLNSHGNILCHGELFGAEKISFAGENRLRIDNIKLRNKFPYLFTKYHYLIERNYSAVGFRLLLDQNEELLEKLVHDKGVKKIFLLRRNELRRVTSAKLAEKSQIWHLKENEERPKNKINIDINKFIEEYEWLERQLKKYFAIIEKTKQNYLCIYYEDLNKEDSLNKIQLFLKVPKRGLSSQFIKQNPESLEELIENFSELESAFVGTKLEWMLEARR